MTNKPLKLIPGGQHARRMPIIKDLVCMCLEREITDEAFGLIIERAVSNNDVNLEGLCEFDSNIAEMECTLLHAARDLGYKGLDWLDGEKEKKSKKEKKPKKEIKRKTNKEA